MNRTLQESQRTLLCILLFAVPACSRPVSPLDLPEPSVVLKQVGKRLSPNESPGSLTKIAAKEERLLKLLNSEERDALGRGYLKFTVDRPVNVIVATDEQHAPFWLADQRFRRSNERPKLHGKVRQLFEKRFEAGVVGLGVDRLDLSSVDHYVVFLQSDDQRPIRVKNISNPNWKVETTGPEVGLGLLKGTTCLQPSPELRSSTPLASGRVWKTHVVAKREPDQVHVTPGIHPTSELSITWRTEVNAGKSLARLREAGMTGLDREISGNSVVLSTPTVLNDPDVRIHNINLSGLLRNREYEYSVGDGTAGGMSPWRSVRTAPGRGDDLQLLYMGDPQCGLEGWGQLLSVARQRNPRASALIIAGDLVDRGNERTNWDHFFLRAAGIFEGLPLLPAVGNHEYLDRGPKLYQSFFQLPENGPKASEPGLVYSVEYGDAFIAVLDSTMAVSDPASATLQGKWLDERLTSTRCPWKLVVFHHPLYASHPWRESLPLRDAWGPIFDKHEVDLVLQGHDHAYLRTYPLRAGQRALSTGDGTTYVVSVSGDKYCEQNPRDYTEVGFTRRSTYQTIDIKPRDGLMTYRAFDIKGNELDRLEWRKPVDRGAVARR